MAVQGPCHKKRKIQSLTQREAAPSRENILQDKVAAIAETLSSQIDVENDETLAACGPAPLSIVRTRPQAVLDLAHEKMHTFPYHSVPVHWRRLYEDASCHLAVSILRAKPFSAEVFCDVVRVLDYALIISGGPGRRSLIELLLQRLYTVLPREAAPSVPRSLPCDPPKALETRHGIARAAHAMDVAEFQAHLDASLTPIIIPGAIDHWPAATKWSDVEYLLECTLNGRRMVPIEIGSSYTDDGWSQKIVSFAEFVEAYLTPSKPVDVGYLAQHDLFTQIPALQDDILVPDYCYALPPNVKDDENGGNDEDRGYAAPLMNAWLGPKGTKTPLHTDPYHNIFCQVMGYKYVRLYAPDQTRFLYPRKPEESGVSMENTSSVDLFHLRPESEPQAGRAARAQELHLEYPLFGDAVYQEAILGPGECLYIPLGWWHYLESLTPSFSVSFWWK